METLSPLERLASRKLGKTVQLTGSVATNPGKLSMRLADHRIAVPACQWEFGSCRRALMFAASSSEIILFVKKQKCVSQ